MNIHIVNNKDLDIIIPTNTMMSVSNQLQSIGETLNLNGTFTFDLILIKGYINNQLVRLIKVTFENGELTNVGQYHLRNNDVNTKIMRNLNNYILNSIPNLNEYLTPDELNELK